MDEESEAKAERWFFFVVLTVGVMSAALAGVNLCAVAWIGSEAAGAPGAAKAALAFPGESLR